MDENNYYYCATHSKCILPEDKQSHNFPDCNFIIMDFQYKTRIKIKKQWAAKTVAEKAGMKIYRKKKEEVIPDSTLPADAIIIESAKPKGVSFNEMVQSKSKPEVQ